jgi:hypothetical protein
MQYYSSQHDYQTTEQANNCKIPNQFDLQITHLRKLTQSRNLPPFMQTDVAMPRTQDRSNDIYREPDETIWA